MRSDETYLEAFVEFISTLPPEVRRNLELMKDMDQSCSALFERLVQEQQEYVHSVEEKILQLEVDGKGVRVLNSGSNGPVVVPTTEELMSYVHNLEARKNIESIQEDALQRAEEKVAIAKQTYSLVDDICKRLDNDLVEMEKILQASGEYQAPGAGAARPDDLAAIQPTGSPDWILAKVITYDPQTGMYQLSDEDVESNKIFNLTESQVIILGRLENLKKGDSVFAVYPDTTSFYQATVVQPPRKVAGGGSFVMVNFVDDQDEHGITHDKAVLLKHIMLPP